MDSFTKGMGKLGDHGSKLLFFKGFSLLGRLQWALACCWVFGGMSLFGAVNMPALFSDGMVLQRGIALPVWGWADEGAAVSVSFGGETVRGQADAEGKWLVKLSPKEASTDGLPLEVQVGEAKKVIEDVLVGEVWLCSGQSNMQWTLKSSSKNSKDKKYMPVVKSIRKEIETASDPLLRQIMVPRITSYLEQKKNFEGNWIDSSPSNNPDFCAAGYYFAKELRRELGVPIGLIHSAYGGTRVQAWVPKDVYAEGTTMSEYYQTMYDDVKEKQAKWDPEKLIKYNKKLKEIKDWKLQQRLARKRPVEPMLNKHNPSTLFNAMITPLVPYGMKGVLWYQGESNTKHLTDQYVNYKKALISSWRKHWGQGDFPFYFTQLANFKKVKVDPLEEDVWASLCDEQRRCLTIPNTGMAVANDIGEADDIHPKNKIDVGKRLALWALAKDYGREELVHSGPLYKDCSFEGAEVSVRFDSVGEGLMVAKKDLLDPAREVDEAVKGFQICGEDRQWVWAKAEISSKDSVKVFHPSVKEPVELRYAWAANPPAANLYNRSGLPTSCFKCSKL